MSNFKVKQKSKKSQARTAILKTPHGQIKTPFFMPIATVGVVKTLSTQDLKNLGAQIILSNTYHLLLRPGMDLMKKVKGVHNFINWPGPILTDSGGFQVYSLSKIRKITDKAVTFQSHIDGQKYELTPKKVLEIQQTLGSDIAMVLDQCVGYRATRREVEKAVSRTTLWAKESHDFINQKIKTRHKKTVPHASCLMPHASLTFAINQGGIYKDLRLQSAQDITNLNFPGYAIGGLAVGEPWPKALKVLDWVTPILPEDKPRYLMGVGYPEQIIQSVKRGIDMFDCVIPTREARHGKLFLWCKAKSHGKSSKKLSIINYQLSHNTIQITNSKFTRNFSPINTDSRFPCLREYSLAYLRHLFKIGEPLAPRLATLNNLEFYLTLMQKIRKAISEGML